MADSKKELEAKIAKEMIPYLINVVWPILIIIFIAHKYGP